MCFYVIHRRLFIASGLTHGCITEHQELSHSHVSETQHIHSHRFKKQRAQMIADTYRHMCQTVHFYSFALVTAVDGGIIFSTLQNTSRAKEETMQFYTEYNSLWLLNWSSCVNSAECLSFKLYALMKPPHTPDDRSTYLSSPWARLLTAAPYSFSCSLFPFALVVHPSQSLSLWNIMFSDCPAPYELKITVSTHSSLLTFWHLP